MLIQFSIKNYKTFSEEVKLSMMANHDKSTRFADNVFHVPQFDLYLLKSAVVYGANASGKTKLIEALNFMRAFILKSANSQSKDKIPVESFRLNSEKEKSSSIFEIIFIHEKVMYRYGFDITKEKVMAEWLYQRPKTKEVELFYREGQNFKVHPTKFKVQDLIDKDRIKPNTLLLSKADAENEHIAKKVFEWFTNHFNLLSGLQEQNYLGYSVSKLNDSLIKQQIVNLLKNADLGIEDLKPQLVSINDLPEDLPKALRETLEREIEENKNRIFGDIFTFHKKYNAKNQHIGMEQFSMDDNESSGTQKYFALSAPILNTLEQGKVLIIDELDAKLHPNLVYKIVEIFNSKETNPRNAQLIFNTHDTNLLSCGLFRRDQIWFTEKDRYGAATLYSLADFKTDKVRKDDNFEKNYIEGKYGAIPYLGDFDTLFNL